MATSFDFEIVADNTEEVLQKLKENTEAALEACGIQAVGHAQDIITENIPRHPGSWYTPKMGSGLRGSISHIVKDDTCYVGTNNEHAIYNEYGTGIYADGGGRQSPWAYQDDKGHWHWTRGIKPIHFLKDALEKNKEEYRAILIEYLSK